MVTALSSSDGSLFINLAAVQELVAVLGGAQLLNANTNDALSLPTESSTRLALRTQQIIGWETGVASTVDSRGSYFVEHLTEKLGTKKRRHIERTDARNDVVSCIDGGFVRREIQEATWKYQQKVENGQPTIVGINRFQEKGLDGKKILKMGLAFSATKLTAYDGKSRSKSSV